MHDVIIIGRGPAGYAASIYTARANLDTIVIGKNDSYLNKAEKIENYFGFIEPISGKELIEKGEKQAMRLGVQILDDEVISVAKNEYFEVKTTKETYLGKALLIATGQPQKKIDVENVQKFEGRGISYCSTCDGFFYRNLKVGVLGSKDFALNEAIELQVYTKDITIYTNGKKLDLTAEFENKKDGFKINEKKVIKVDGGDAIEKIYFEDGSNEDLDGLFLANDSASSVDFAKKLGIIVEGNSIVVDKFQKTNFDGVFAAGDCTGGFKQVSTAVGQGAMAAKMISEYIRDTYKGATK